MDTYDEALFAAKSFVAREFELLADALKGEILYEGTHFPPDVAHAAHVVATIIQRRANDLRAHLCTEADRDAAERKRAAELMGEYVGKDLER